MAWRWFSLLRTQFKLKSDKAEPCYETSTSCVSLLLVLETVQKPHEGPGEMGKPVVIPKEDQEKMKEMFKINQFNLMASEMIALNRSLPDVRLEG